MTGRHSRLEHSMGTFSVMCRYIRSLYNDPLNPLFKQIMTSTDLRAGLLAALLHDIGQYPMAHDFEEACQSLFDHEEIGDYILANPEAELEYEITASEEDGGWGVSLNRIRSILSAEPQLPDKGAVKDRILHSMLNGPMDADKLDYIMRDSQRLGLAYGNILDIDRILRCLTILMSADATNVYAWLGVHEKGRIPAESIAYARYAMFGQVYWHHSYRSIKAMIHMMIWEMLGQHDSDLNQIKQQFARFVRPGNGFLVDHEEDLWPDKAEHQESQIDRTDLAVLRWVSKRTGGIGENLLSMLRQRKLYKRACVFTNEGDDSYVWDKAYKFYSDYGTKWFVKQGLQKLYQQALIRAVETKRDNGQINENDCYGNLMDLLSEGYKGVLTIVDMPAPRTKYNSEFKVLVEEDRGHAKSNDLEAMRLTQSKVWDTLNETGSDSIRPLRIFCHPDHVETLRGVLSREEMRTELARSLEEAAKIRETG